jgi:carbamoyl-phosphate synthase small subunit
MPFTNLPAARLLLANGRLFHGHSVVAAPPRTGELCFHTGMTGWQEMLSDPSYTGQLLVLSTAHVGNTGVLPEDLESDGVRVAGLLARSVCREPSGARGGEALPHWLAHEGVPCVDGLDTRSLVQVLRTEGAMNAVLSTGLEPLEELREQLEAAPSMAGRDLTGLAGCGQAWELPAEAPRFRVAVLDCGVKHSILRELSTRGCTLGIFPPTSTAAELMSWRPHGIFLSNGPGDPAASTAPLECVRALPPHLPLFGICLGHQLLALAYGARTVKLPFGHRGANHPVLCLKTGHVWITSQNHGFAVADQSLPEALEITHTSLNDGTVEGLRLRHRPAFSVQFHPEAAPGPREARVAFDHFITLLEEHQREACHARAH